MAIDLVLCICVFGCVRLVWGEGWCSGSGGTGIVVTGYKAHQDPCAPLRGDTWPETPDRPPHHKQTVHPPAKQPDTQMVAAKSVSIFLLEAEEIKSTHLSSVCFRLRLRNPLISGNNKNMAHSTLLYFLHSHLYLHLYLPHSGPPTEMAGPLKISGG